MVTGSTISTVTVSSTAGIYSGNRDHCVMSHKMIQTMLLLCVGLISLHVQHCKAQDIVNVLEAPIPVESRRLNIRRFAALPNYNGRPSKIVGMTEWRNDLYVCTSVSGGYIYRVTPRGEAILWFDVPSTLKKFGRQVELEEQFHGGVRSIAFHRSALSTGLFYISLVERRLKPPSSYRYLSFPTSGSVAPSDSVIYEFKVNPNTLVVDGSSMREVLRVGLKNIDHPIKQIAFKRHMLYIGHGDGSVHSNIAGTGQNGMDALGKILRIKPRQGKNGEPYTLPRGNPFIGKPGVLDEIYALGFRNPHNLCFARKRPRDLFVVDAGRDNVEEVNIVKSGRNYGWSLREGPFVHLPSGGLGNGIRNLPPDDGRFNFTYPAAALGHVGRRGIGFDEAHQAIVGSCPIENNSPLNNLYLISNFPSDGNIYFAYVSEMRAAQTMTSLGKLTRARLYQPPMYFDDDNSRTFRKRIFEFRDIVKMDRTAGTYDQRSDTRFGRGSRGEIYISSKQTGRIYLIENSLPFSAPPVAPSPIPPPISPPVAPPTNPPVTAPSTVPPSTVPPSTIPPSTVPPSTVFPSTIPPSTIPPSTVSPGTVLPSTVPPSTNPPSTVAPSTIPPSTIPPNTIPPSTALPSTVAPSTVPPSTALPVTSSVAQLGL